MFDFIQQWMKSVEARISQIERTAAEMLARLQSAADTARRASEKIENQQETLFGTYTALCVSTKDPEGACRVSFFSPHFYHADVTVDQLNWAVPIRNSGGIDDTGWNWVPQAGSLLCLQFANGNRNLPQYIGTTWYRDKSFYNQGLSRGFIKFWEEYDQYHKGHRRGYMLGPNDDSQCHQPCSSEMYNRYDPDDTTPKIVTNADGQQEYADAASVEAGATIPFIYCCATGQKHRLKFVDGIYDAFFKYKRVELISSLGNAFLMKDDFLNGCDAIANNPFMKHAQELWPWLGPGTPQNNKFMLPQTGVQFMTRAGATWFGDDSVESPQGTPGWEANFETVVEDGQLVTTNPPKRKPFDFGSTDRFLGKTGWISALGETIMLSDEESSTGIRSENCGIFINSTTGAFIQLCNHTNPDGTAGDKRGWRAGSSSGHVLEMMDAGNAQDLPTRKAGAEPVNNATAAFVSLRSGGGIELRFNEGTSQQETADQYAFLYMPQKDNPDRPGGHMLRFQARKDGPGQVTLQVGGDYIVTTTDNHETNVGSTDMVADKVVKVSGHNVETIAADNVSMAKNHRFYADEVILMLAGKDEEEHDAETGEVDYVPRSLSVVVWDPDRGLVASDRLFASASLNAKKIPISTLMPFTIGQGDDPQDQQPTEVDETVEEKSAQAEADSESGDDDE